MTVVAAVDGSEHTKSVVDAAVRYARDGEIHFLYVTSYAIYSYGVVDSRQPIEFEAIQKRQVDAVWEAVGTLPTNAQTVTLEGDASSTIVDYAKSVDADLIVIGSRGRGAFGSLFLGSVSHGVVHAADRDVLIVRSQTGADIK